MVLVELICRLLCDFSLFFSKVSKCLCNSLVFYREKTKGKEGCCDVLTYEFENVDADGLDAVIKDGQLPQGTELLRISQNRIFEKDFLSNKAQVTVAPYKVVTSSLDLEDIDLSKSSADVMTF